MATARPAKPEKVGSQQETITYNLTLQYNVRWPAGGGVECKAATKVAVTLQNDGPKQEGRAAKQ